ncbi:MAG: portal protein [Paraclostridium sp.]
MAKSKKTKKEDSLYYDDFQDLSEDEIRAKLVEQCTAEYKLSTQDQQEWLTKMLKRMSLYNNQTKSEDVVGDLTMYIIFNTVLSAIYDDKLDVSFGPKDDGDIAAANMWSEMAESDYSDMRKDEQEYDVLWNAAMFSVGYTQMSEYDTDKLVPLPEVIDPLTFVHDPAATSIHGDSAGRGSARFFGYPKLYTKWNLKDLGFDENDIKTVSESGYGANDTKIKEAQRARAKLQANSGMIDKDVECGDNQNFVILKWYTHIGGKKCVVYLANNGENVLKRHGKLYTELPFKRWDIVDYRISPIPHQWNGVSISDLVEDKQRAKAILLNLAIKSAISDSHPSYLFDRSKIDSRQDLSPGFNKWIPVKGTPDNVVIPLKRDSINNSVKYIMDLIDFAAQKAAAAPEISQGVQQKTERTLGELELISQGRAGRNNLIFTVYVWAEKKFWSMWMEMHNYYMSDDDVDNKLIQISTPSGDAYKKITKGDLSMNKDPRIIIKSKLAEQERMSREFSKENQVVQIVMQVPEVNRGQVARSVLRKLGKTELELDIMIPPTPDDIIAREQNKMLNGDQLPEVLATDNHIIHIANHSLADNTPSTRAHIAAHYAMIAYMKENPMAEQELGMQPQMQQQGQQFSPVKIPYQGVDGGFTPQGSNRL